MRAYRGASIRRASLLTAAALLVSADVRAQEQRRPCPDQAKEASSAEHALCWFERAQSSAKECEDAGTERCTDRAAAWCSDAALDDPRVANACFLSLVRTGQPAEAVELAEYLTEPTPAARRCREALTSVAKLRVVSNPAGGTVAVDGQTYGPSPMEVRLSTPWWDHHITVTFGNEEVSASTEDILGAFDDRACEMTDLVVEGPDGSGEGDSGVASPREAAQTASPSGWAAAGGNEARDRRDSEGGIHTRWWFWTGVGAVVAGAVLTGVLLSTSSEDVQREDPIPGDDGRVIRALEMP